MAKKIKHEEQEIEILETSDINDLRETIVGQQAEIQELKNLIPTLNQPVHGAPVQGDPVSSKVKQPSLAKQALDFFLGVKES